MYRNPGNRCKKIVGWQQFLILKKALPYFHGVFLASGMVILLIYRDLHVSDFFNSRVSTPKAEKSRITGIKEIAINQQNNHTRSKKHTMEIR